MRPSFEMNNSVYRTLPNAKTLANFSLSDALLAQFSNLANIFVGKVGIGAFFPLAPSVSALVHLVFHVGERCPGKQMIGINARGCVASMARQLSFAQRAMMNLVAETMGGIGDTSQVELPIPAATYRSAPKPTFILWPWRNVVPESFLWRLRKHSVAICKSARMTLRIVFEWAISIRWLGRLAAPALALAVWLQQAMFSDPRGIFTYVFGKDWGNMSVHENLHFSAKPRAFRDAAGHFLLGCYSFILPYSVEYGNAYDALGG